MDGLPQISSRILYILILQTHCRELMESAGTHGKPCHFYFLVMKKVMGPTLCEERFSRKDMTALIVMLPSKLFLWKFLCNLVWHVGGWELKVHTSGQMC